MLEALKAERLKCSDLLGKLLNAKLQHEKDAATIATLTTIIDEQKAKARRLVVEKNTLVAARAQWASAQRALNEQISALTAEVERQRVALLQIGIVEGRILLGKMFNKNQLKRVITH